MTIASAVQPRSAYSRGVYATIGALLLAAIAVEAITQSAGYWQIAAFGLGPDLALFYGIGSGLQKGQLHPRAVGLYNLAHRFWAPLLLATLAAFAVVPRSFVLGALVWGFHISLDRAVGYGLRTRDGFQRS